MDLANQRVAVFRWMVICGLGLGVFSPWGKGEDPPSKLASANLAISSRIAAQYPTAVSISPDGTQILLRTAKWESDELSVVSTRTRQVISRIESKDTPLSMSWSPTGSEIAYFVAEGNGDVFRTVVWNLSDHSARILDGPTTSVSIQPPRWSPDGKALAYLVGNIEDASLWVVDPHGQQSPRPLTAHVRPRSDFDWSPNGHEMAVVLVNSPAALQILQVIDGKMSTGVPIGKIARSEIRDLSWAPDSKALAVAARVAGDFRELVRVDLDKHRVFECESPEGNVIAPHYAPDNRTILYSLSKNAEMTLHSTHCDGHPSQNIGFGSGTSRFVRFLKVARASKDEPVSVAVLHTGLEEPSSLYRVAIQSGVPELIYRSPNSNQLRSRRPQIINVSSADGAQIPTIFWAGNTDNGSLGLVLIDVHGGPHLESDHRWEFLPSLLASLGIDVLSPNYDGSSGYGYRYEEAGDVGRRAREIIAVCKYGKSLHQGRTRVMLMGTSYGTYLAASAAVSDPQDIDGLILVSLVAVNGGHSQLNNVAFPIFCFHGKNDPLRPENARALLLSFFGETGADSGKDLWRIFPGEGHVFRHTHSWTDVYTGIVSMAERISGKSLQCCMK
jgi:dipeptidyl aminopeptidase/acylaminoacyl peptidase